MPDDAAWLRDMLDAAAEALERAEGYDRSAFLADRDKQLALMYLIVQIGEAASHVHERTRAQMLGVPWRQVVGMRHRLVHHYFEVQPDLVWDVVENDLRGLIQEVERYLAAYGPEGERGAAP